MARVFRRKNARVDENPDRHGHLTLVDEVVEDNRGAKVSIFLHVRLPVLKHHDASWLGRVVLGWNVDKVVAHGPGEDLALPGLLRDLAAGDPLLDLGIGAELVFLVARQGGEGE